MVPPGVVIKDGMGACLHLKSKSQRSLADIIKSQGVAESVMQPPFQALTKISDEFGKSALTREPASGGAGKQNDYLPANLPADSHDGRA